MPDELLVLTQIADAGWVAIGVSNLAHDGNHVGVQLAISRRRRCVLLFSQAPRNLHDRNISDEDLGIDDIASMDEADH